MKKIAQKLNYIRDLIIEGSSHSGVKEIALSILESSKTCEEKIKSIYNYIINNISYVNEVEEKIQPVSETLSKQFGDCEDHVILIGAIALNLNIPVRIISVPVGIINTLFGIFSHVFCKLYDLTKKKWIAVETTVDEQLGYEYQGLYNLEMSV